MDDLVKIKIENGRAHFDPFLEEGNKGINKHNKFVALIRKFLSLCGIASGTFKFEGIYLNKKSAYKWIKDIDPSISENELKSSAQLALRIYFLNFKKSAEQGKPEGEYQLGSCYTTGFGVEKNPQKAFEHYQKAADKGHAKAQVHVGRCFSEGIGVGKDDVKAFDYFLRAAKNGENIAQLQVGIFCKQGKGCPQDNTKYIEWCQKAAAQGNVIALEILGMEYSKGKSVQKDEKQAHDYFLKAAEKGSTFSQYRLGSIYLNAVGVDRNIETALSWYKKAAKQGHVTACEDLANFYHYGINVDRNAFQSINYQIVASKNGSQIRNYTKGVDHLIGVKMPVDKVKAQKYFEKVNITKEHFDALSKKIVPGIPSPVDKFNLAIYYELGFGISVDLMKAKSLFEEARNEGHPYAQSALDVLCK